MNMLINIRNFKTIISIFLMKLLRKIERNLMMKIIHITSGLKNGGAEAILYLVISNQINKFQHEVYPIVVGASIVPANSKPHEKDNFDF